MIDDIIVEILKYGKTKKPDKGQGFTMDDITKHLKGLGFAMDHDDVTTLNVIMGNCFMLNVPSTGQYVMKADGYFTLLEYQELYEARESSKQANKWALIALTVSIVATLCSIFFSLKQIYTPTEIRQVQIDQITQTVSKQNNLIDSLLQVTKKQNASIDSLLKTTKEHFSKKNSADTSKTKKGHK